MIGQKLRAVLYRAVTQTKQARRRFRNLQLRLRWGWTKQPEAFQLKERADPEDVFKRLEVIVINLDSRPDRLLQFTDEMKRIGIGAWRRLRAVDGREEYPDLHPYYSGSIGCSLSHVLAFREAKWDEVDAVLICEDDVQFLVDKPTLASAIDEFLDNPRLDVLALYGRARGGSHQISPQLRIVVGLVGTVCYVIKPHMASVVGDLFIRGVNDLERGNRRGKSDIIWNKLQRQTYYFAAPRKKYSQNREGFSDIEGRQLGAR